MSTAFTIRAGAGATTPSYLLTDERGSVIGQSNASGVISVNAYDEYGLAAPGNTGTFGYTGQMTLPGSSGLLNYRMRTYDPRIGRFLQMDPIGYQGGMNLFAYVGGDPMNLTDPWGLDRSGTGTPPSPNPGCTIIYTKSADEDGNTWNEACRPPIIIGDWTMVDARFNFGLPSGGGGRYAIAASGGQEVPGPNRDQPACQRIRGWRAGTEGALPTEYTESWRWNDLGALHYDLSQYERARQDGTVISWGLTLLSAGAGFANKWVGLGLSGGAALFSLDASSFSSWADAIEFRIAELEDGCA